MLTEPNGASAIPGRVVTIDMLIIASLWCVSLVVVNPLGNFPLNDDWSYGLTVEHFVNSGDFRPTPNTAMPLLSNVLWGSLFCIPRGFSFTALRLSTLTLSLVGILAVYLLMRELRQPRWLAVTAAVTLGSNPIYYALSNTFMTDTHYIAITILAAIFFARSLRNGSDLDLTIGTAFAIAGILSRQVAISVPLAFAVALILKHGFTRRNTLRAAIPVALCLGALLAFQHWLTGTGRLPALYHVKEEDLLLALSNPKTLVLSLAKNTFAGLLYLGLFLLPILLYALADVVRSHRRQAIAFLTFALGTMALGSGVVALHGFQPAGSYGGALPITRVMPMSGNVLMKSGIGPLMLPDNWLGLKYVPDLPALPSGFWLAVTALSVVGAGFLITIVGVRAINLTPTLRHGLLSDNEAVGIFFLLSAMIYLLPLFASNYIDRYLVPPTPFFAAGIACLAGYYTRSRPAYPRLLRFLAMGLLAASSLFAVGTTRDYLAWNRLRWDALHDLVENRRVNVQDIDGGLEFNALYMYDLHYKYNPTKNWWWVRGDTYRICFGTMPGYKVIKEYRYSHWVPPHAGKVVVLQKCS